MKKVIVLLFCVIGCINAKAQTATVAEKLAQEQLDGYNARDIEAFLKPYSDSVEVYMFPNQLMYKGKEIMRQEYAKMFAELPDLHCTIKARIVLGNKVIDEESVIFDKNRPAMRAAAIYTVAKDKIVAVYFISQQ